MTAKDAKTRTLPTQARRSPWRGRAIIGGALLLAVTLGGGWWFFLRAAPVRADVLLHTVKREVLVVSVTEKGTLESSENTDITCKVRAGTKGFASTINWVIDDGTRVQRGQELMRLDDSALKDQADDQQIKVDTALANKIKAEKDYEIAVKSNQKDIATAESVLTKANNDLKDFTGLTYDPSRLALSALGGGPMALSEAGTYRQKLDDANGQVSLAESDVDQYRERAAWADRMVKLTYMTAAQAQAERSKLDSAVETLRSKKAALTQMINSTREQDLTKLTLDRDIAQITLEQVVLSADAKLVQFDAEKKRATAEYVQQTEKLRDLVAQRAECQINAPNTIEPGSLVVYFKNESNRFGNSSSQAMIEQGAQVKEGQKMLRIPNLSRMQVNTKVHEAMVSRIRGDVRTPTHFVDGLLSLYNVSPLTRGIGQRSEIVDQLRQKFRQYEYKTVSRGQKARIRVDALPDRVFAGHVRTVAAVASQADAFASDVKLYQTLVVIDHEVLPDGTTKEGFNEELKPDMTAEVTITVDTAKEPVLNVPVQAIIGGTEMGAEREVFVKTPTGYERRSVKLGLYNEKVVEIREGLSEDEQVVLNPKVLLAPDDKTRTRDEGGKNGKAAPGGEGKGGAPKDGSGGGPPAGPGGGGGGKGKKGPPPTE